MAFWQAGNKMHNMINRWNWFGRTWIRRVLAGAMLAGVLVSASTADTLYKLGAPPQDGEFAGYEGDLIIFRDADQQPLKLHPQMVQKIEVDPAAEVDLELKSTPGETQRTVRGYQAPFFIFQNGAAEERIHIQQVRAIKRYSGYDWTPQFTAAGRLISHGEEIDIQSQLKPGLLNVVLFYAPRHDYCTKMQAYISRLQNMNAGQVEYLKIEISNPNAPARLQYNLRTLPEIWIYNRRGEQVERLQGEMMPRDIDAAFVRAQRSTLGGNTPAP